MDDEKDNDMKRLMANQLVCVVNFMICYFEIKDKVGNVDINIDFTKDKPDINIDFRKKEE